MVPSCRKRGDMARARTESFVSPRLAARQVYPPSVERKTPPPKVPANTVRSASYAGENVTTSTLRSVSPSPALSQDSPPFVERRMPSPDVPAKMVRSFSKSGETARAGTNDAAAASCQLSPPSNDRRTPPVTPANTCPSAGRPGGAATVHAKPPGGPTASERPCASSRGDGQISTTTASARNMAAVFSAAARLMGCASQATGSGTGHPNPKRTPLSSSISSALTGSDGGREGPKSRPMAAMSAFLVRACPPERASSLP